MVNFTKMLKLGGFSESIQLLKVSVEHFGFARKQLPPDTPHAENKTRWTVNTLGQKVVDTGTPIEQEREKWISEADKTYAIPEDASMSDRQELITKRCDYIRTLCALAEKGDEPTGDYLLQVLEKDPSPEVRKTVLHKLVFAARGPTTPYHRKVVKGTLVALSDVVAEIRGLVTWLQEQSIREWDHQEVRTQIKPQRHKQLIARRGQCTAPGQISDGGHYARLNKAAEGGGAWQQVRDLAMAVNDKFLVSGVIDMMTHPVLPVRMAAWETFGAEISGGAKGRCRELEALSYQNLLKFEEMSLVLNQLQKEADTCMEEIMEENRNNIQRLIEKKSMQAELSADLVAKIIADYREHLATNNERFVHLKARLDAHKANYEEQEDCLRKDQARYQSICADMNAEIMLMIGSLLEENCAVLESVNKLCGNGGQGNWYVRRCLIRILEPMAVAGQQNALKLLENSREDRSPYVRRTVQRSLRAVWLAERERTALAEITEAQIERPETGQQKSAQEIEAEEQAQALKRLQGGDECDTDGTIFEEAVHEPTLEEKRLALKALKLKKAAVEEEARIKALNVSEYDWNDVVDLLESLRPKFESRVDTYVKQVRLHKYTGAKLIEMCQEEDSLIPALKMDMRKHRLWLKDRVTKMVDEWHDAVDENKKQERMNEAVHTAARDDASKLRELTRDKRAAKGGRGMQSALRFDNYAYGSATGLGAILRKDEKGDILFCKVIPCGGLVNDGDQLVRVGATPVAGLSISEVKKLFDEIDGETAPCLVVLASEKERRKQMDEIVQPRQMEKATQSAANHNKNAGRMGKTSGKANGKVSTNVGGGLQPMEENVQPQALEDLMRTVHVTCQPPPFKEKYLDTMGLDIEVYQGDATRSLQVMTFLQRNGFTQLLSRILVELKIKQLKQLAERFRDDTWINSIGIKNKSERGRFKQLLERLAFRYGLKEAKPELAFDDIRPDAHKGWMFITGAQNAIQRQYQSAHRTFDHSQDLDEYFRHGRTPVTLINKSNGMDYTLCWHPDRKIAVELMHASAGTMRFAMMSENQEFSRASSFERTRSASKTGSLPGVSGEFDFYVVFSDGQMERTDKLNAEGLMLELISQPRPQTPEDSPESKGSRPVTSSVCKNSRPGTSFTHTSNIHGAVAEEDEERHSKPDSSHGVMPSMEAKKEVMLCGGNMGLFSRKSAKEQEDSDEESDAESEPDSDEEDVVGYHCEPLVGHRVILREVAAKKFPDLAKETENSTGTITWVDPTDADGDGITGDICEVHWDNGYIADYRTGFEGTFRLQLDPEEFDVNQRLNIGAEEDEEIVGLDIEPLEGQRVVLMTAAIRENPSLKLDSEGGPGTILWVDPEDADGDGITGDICEVQWDLTGTRADYRTGFEGAFRLAIYDPGKAERKRAAQESKTKVKIARDPNAPRFRTIDMGREQPPDDPWAFWDEATAEEKRCEDAELAESARFKPENLVGYRMNKQGPKSCVRAGSWMIQTRDHGNGTTIGVRFDPASRMLGDKQRLATDAKRLGLKLYHGGRQHYISEQAKHMENINPFTPFAVHLTSDGLVVIAEEQPPLGIHCDRKRGIRPAKAGRASIITNSGIEEIGVEDAELVVEGVPRNKIAEVLSLKRSTSIAMSSRAGTALQPDALGDIQSEFGSSRPGTSLTTVSKNSSSRPGSSGFLRMSTPAEKAVPQSIRSVLRNAKHQRPITPVTGKPYTGLRPSSRGSVRHVLNLENAFGVGQDMLSRDGVTLQELRAKDDFGRQMRMAQEANVIIEDDGVR